MDIEKGLYFKKENKNFIRSKFFISKIKLVVKKLNHIPIIFLCIFFVSSILECNNLTIIKNLLLIIIIQMVIFLYRIFYRKKGKKYS